MSFQSYIKQLKIIVGKYFVDTDDLISDRYLEIKSNKKDLEKYNEAVKKLNEGSEAEIIKLESGEELTLTI